LRIALRLADELEGIGRPRDRIGPYDSAQSMFVGLVL